MTYFNEFGQARLGWRSPSSGGGGSTIDADAQAFITAASITDTTQQSAINTLVTQLKTYGIWSKMKALYPFVGGTASSHKYNLKDPRDLDAAFRLVFNGGWTHSTTGALPNGTTAYADTKLVPSTTLTQYNSHLSYYSRSQTLSSSNIEFGAYNTDAQCMFLTLQRSGGNGGAVQYSISADSNMALLFGNTTTTGMYLSNRTSSTATSLKYIRNGVSLANATTTAGSLPSIPLFLGGSNNLGSPFYYSAKESAFASIGDGLTDAESLAFYTAVQTFQTTLGRQVGVPIVADSDAQAFLNAAVITNQTQASAINTLVTSLKSANIWTKMKAIYPFVGGTAASHKFNLKDPRDLDAAFRLVFNGGWTHSTTGALPNGTTAYADTKLIPSSAISNQSSAHLSFYSNTNSFPTVNGTIKANGGYTFPPLKGLQIGYWKRGSGQNTYYFQIGGGTEILVDTATPTSQGFLLGSRTSSTAAKLYQNNTTLGSSSTLTTDGLSSAVTYLGARNGNSVIEQYHNLNHQFTSIGDGLTDAEATALYNAVQAYQTTLGRQI